MYNVWHQHGAERRARQLIETHAESLVSTAGGLSSFILRIIPFVILFRQTFMVVDMILQIFSFG